MRGRPASRVLAAVHDELAVDDHVVDPDRELLRLRPRRRRLDRSLAHELGEDDWEATIRAWVVRTGLSVLWAVRMN